MFNASLILFAVGMIYSDESREIPSREEKLQSIVQVLRVAVVALPTLDKGNGTIDKCQRYLRKLLDMDLLRGPGTTPMSVRSGLTRPLTSPALSQLAADSKSFFLDTQDWVLDDLDLGFFGAGAGGGQLGFATDAGIGFAPQ